MYKLGYAINHTLLTGINHISVLMIYTSPEKLKTTRRKNF